MSGEIKAGDLVMVVRGHKCVIDRAGGVPFKASIVLHDPRLLRCGFCGKKSIAGNEVIVGGFGLTGIPARWLFKIDPPAIPESTPVSEEIHA